MLVLWSGITRSRRLRLWCGFLVETSGGSRSLGSQGTLRLPFYETREIDLCPLRLSFKVQNPDSSYNF